MGQAPRKLRCGRRHPRKRIPLFVSALRLAWTAQLKLEDGKEVCHSCVGNWRKNALTLACSRLPPALDHEFRQPSHHPHSTAATASPRHCSPHSRSPASSSIFNFGISSRCSACADSGWQRNSDTVTSLCADIGSHVRISRRRSTSCSCWLKQSRTCFRRSLRNLPRCKWGNSLDHLRVTRTSAPWLGSDQWRAKAKHCLAGNDILTWSRSGRRSRWHDT